MTTERRWFKRVAALVTLAFTSAAVFEVPAFADAKAPSKGAAAPKAKGKTKTKRSAQSDKLMEAALKNAPAGRHALKGAAGGALLTKFASRFKTQPKELGVLMPMKDVIAAIKKESKGKKGLPGDPILLEYERWLAEKKKPENDANKTAPGELEEKQQEAFKARYGSVLIPDIKTYALFMHDIVFERRKVKSAATRAELMFQYACRALSRVLPGFAKIVEVKIVPGTDLTGNWDAPVGLSPEPPKKKDSGGKPPAGKAEEKPREEIVEVCSVTHRQVEETIQRDLSLIANAIDGKDAKPRDIVTVSPEPKLTGKAAPRNLNSQKLDKFDPRLTDLTFRDITKRLLSFHRKKGASRNFARAIESTKGINAKLGKGVDAKTPDEALKESKHHTDTKVMDSRNRREMLRRAVEQWTYGYEYESIAQLVVPKVPKLLGEYKGAEEKLADEFWSDCQEIHTICEEPRDGIELKACKRCALFALDQHCIDGKDKGKAKGSCREVKDSAASTSVEKRKEELLSEKTADKCGEDTIKVGGSPLPGTPEILKKGKSGYYKIAKPRFDWHCGKTKESATCADGTEWIEAIRSKSDRDIKWKCFKGDPPGQIVVEGLKLKRWPGTFKGWLGVQFASQANQVSKYASKKDKPEDFLRQTTAYVLGKKFLADKDDEEKGFTRAGLRYLDSLPLTAWQRCVLWSPNASPEKTCAGRQLDKLKAADIAKQPWHLSIMAKEAAKEKEIAHALATALKAAQDQKPPGGYTVVPTSAESQGLEPDQKERMSNSADTASEAASPIIGKLLGMLLKAAGLYDTMKALAQAAGLTPAQSADCEDAEYRHEVMQLGGKDDNKRSCLLRIFAKNFGSVLESIIIMLGNKLVDWGVDIIRGALQAAKTSLIASAGSVPFAGGFLAGLVDILWELILNFGLKAVLKGFVVAQLPVWLKVKELASKPIDKLVENPIVSAVLGVILFLIDSAMVHGEKGWMEVGIETALVGLGKALEKANEPFWMRAFTFAKKKLREQSGIASGQEGGMLDQVAKLGKAMLEGFFVALSRTVTGEAAQQLEQAKTAILSLDLASIAQQLMTNPLDFLRKQLVPQVGRLIVPIVSAFVTIPDWAQTLLAKAAKLIISVADPKAQKIQDPWKEVVDTVDALGKALLERLPVAEPALRGLLEQGYAALVGVARSGQLGQPAAIAKAFLDAMNPVVVKLAGAITDPALAADRAGIGEALTSLAGAVGAGNAGSQKAAGDRVRKVVTALGPILEATAAKALAYPPVQKMLTRALTYIGTLASSTGALSAGQVLTELDGIFGTLAEQAAQSLFSAGLPRELARVTLAAARAVLRDPAKLSSASKEAGSNFGKFVKGLIAGKDGLLAVLTQPVKSDALRAVLEKCLEAAMAAAK